MQKSSSVQSKTLAEKHIEEAKEKEKKPKETEKAKEQEIGRKQQPAVSSTDVEKFQNIKSDDTEEKKLKVRSKFSSAIKKLSRKSVRTKDKELSGSNINETATTTKIQAVPAVATESTVATGTSIESNESVIISGDEKRHSENLESCGLSDDSDIKRSKTNKKPKLSKSLFGLKRTKNNANNNNIREDQDTSSDGTVIKSKSLKSTNNKSLVKPIVPKKYNDNERTIVNQGQGGEYKNKFQFTISAKKIENSNNNNLMVETDEKQLNEEDYLTPLDKNDEILKDVTSTVTVTQVKNNCSERSSTPTQTIRDRPPNERAPLKPSRSNITINNGTPLQQKPVDITSSQAKGAIKKSTISKARQSKNVPENKTAVGSELNKSPPLKLKGKNKGNNFDMIAIGNNEKNSTKVINKPNTESDKRLLRSTLIINTTNLKNNNNNNELYNITKYTEEEHHLELPETVMKQNIQTKQPQQKLTTTIKATTFNKKNTNNTDETQTQTQTPTQTQKQRQKQTESESQSLEPPNYPPPLPPQILPPLTVPPLPLEQSPASTIDADYQPNVIRSTATEETEATETSEAIKTAAETTTTTTAISNHHTSLNTISNSSYCNNSIVTTPIVTTIASTDGTSAKLNQQYLNDNNIISVTSVQTNDIDDNILLTENNHNHSNHSNKIKQSLSPIIKFALGSPVRPQYQIEQQEKQQPGWIVGEDYKSIKYSEILNHPNYNITHFDSTDKQLQQNIVDIRRRIQYISQPTLYDDLDSLELKRNNYRHQSAISDLSLDSITDNNVTVAATKNNTWNQQSEHSQQNDTTEEETSAAHKEGGTDNVKVWPMPAFGDLAMDQDKEPTVMTSINTEKREHLYKILVIGELGTGKTSFIKRYVHQFFSQNYRATIGVDFALKVLHWDANTVVRLQLWDIAGQERFGNMTRVYYKEAVGAFIVFDVTRSGTFDCVIKWKEDLDSKVQLPDGSPIPCILLANKCDQEKQGTVTNADKMDEYIKENGFSGWFETSAKENINIDEAARALVNKILLNDKMISASDLTDMEKFNLNNSDNKTVNEEKSKCSC